MNSKSIPNTVRLEDIDPIVAWQAWEPSDDEPWDAHRSSLLIRRSGFGATHEQLQETLALRPENVVAEMVRAATDKSQVSAFEKESAAKPFCLSFAQ